MRPCAPRLQRRGQVEACAVAALFKAARSYLDTDLRQIGGQRIGHRLVIGQRRLERLTLMPVLVVAIIAAQLEASVR